MDFLALYIFVGLIIAMCFVLIFPLFGIAGAIIVPIILNSSGYYTQSEIFLFLIIVTVIGAIMGVIFVAVGFFSWFEVISSVACYIFAGLIVVHLIVLWIASFVVTANATGTAVASVIGGISILYLGIAFKSRMKKVDRQCFGVFGKEICVGKKEE